MTFDFLIHVVAAAVLVMAGIVFFVFFSLVVSLFIDAIKVVFKGMFQ
jgi:hypothetical protein